MREMLAWEAHDAQHPQDSRKAQQVVCVPARRSEMHSEAEAGPDLLAVGLEHLGRGAVGGGQLAGCTWEAGGERGADTVSPGVAHGAQMLSSARNVLVGWCEG